MLTGNGTFLASPDVARQERRYSRAEVALAVALLLPNLVLLGIFTYRPLLDNIRLSLSLIHI